MERESYGVCNGQMRVFHHILLQPSGDELLFILSSVKLIRRVRRSASKNRQSNISPSPVLGFSMCNFANRGRFSAPRPSPHQPSALNSISLMSPSPSSASLTVHRQQPDDGTWRSSGRHSACLFLVSSSCPAMYWSLWSQIFSRA